MFVTTLWNPITTIGLLVMFTRPRKNLMLRCLRRSVPSDFIIIYVCVLHTRCPPHIAAEGLTDSRGPKCKAIQIHPGCPTWNKFDKINCFFCNCSVVGTFFVFSYVILLIQIPWTNAGKPLQKLVASCYHVPSACCTTKPWQEITESEHFMVLVPNTAMALSGEVLAARLAPTSPSWSFRWWSPTSACQVAARRPWQHQGKTSVSPVSLQRGIQNGWAKKPSQQRRNENRTQLNCNFTGVRQTWQCLFQEFVCNLPSEKKYFFSWMQPPILLSTGEWVDKDQFFAQSWKIEFQW